MTTNVLRPNGSTDGPGTATTIQGGAGSLHAAVNDDSDTTYIVVDETGNYVDFDFGTITLAPDVVKQVRSRLRLRAATNAGTDAITFQGIAGIVDDGDDAYLEVIFADDDEATTITTHAGSWINGADWGQSVITDYRARVGNNTVGTPSQDIWIYEVFLDVVTVDQPVVVVDAVSPDPYTASTLVPISWSNTLDSDGGVQTRYEIKVFDETTYGVGFSGLDPDTDTPYYTTGEIPSSSTGPVNVGPIETGDTYRVAVRTAQTVNGASHWSDWDTDDFDLSVTTSEVDTVTVAPVSSLGYLTVTCARDGASAAWGTIEVQRSIDAGMTWKYVRGAAGVDATGNANSFVVNDYEAPNGVSALYRARATYLSSGLPISGSWVQSSPPTSWTSNDWWIKDPTDPTGNEIVKPATIPQWSYQQRRGVHRVLGSAIPVVVSDVHQARVTSVTFRADSRADADALISVLKSSGGVLFQAPPDFDSVSAYVSVGRILDRPAASRLQTGIYWITAEQMTEIDAPADPTAGV